MAPLEAWGKIPLAILASPSGRLNSDANSMPDSNANACVEMNKQAVAKYNIQMPNTNAMFDANVMAGALSQCLG